MKRMLCGLLVMFALVVVVGCKNGGDFSLLGYSTKPPFDPTIRSVYIPTIKNPVFHTEPFRGLEVDLTEEIVREVNRRRSPIRIVSDPTKADSELVGTITAITKGPLSTNLSNFPREYNVIIGCQFVWRDNRTAKNLSGSRNPTFPEQPVPFDPNREAPPPPGPDLQPNPITVSGFGRVIPELGESTTTGMQSAMKQIARQVVNMMEAPW
jgi:Lipopolysaccharide-assembly